MLLQCNLAEHWAWGLLVALGCLILSASMEPTSTNLRHQFSRQPVTSHESQAARVSPPYAAAMAVRSPGSVILAPFLYPTLFRPLQTRVSCPALRRAHSSSATPSTVNDLPESRLNPHPDDYTAPSFVDKAELTLQAGVEETVASPFSARHSCPTDPQTAAMEALAAMSTSRPPMARPHSISSLAGASSVLAVESTDREAQRVVPEARIW